MPSWKDEYPKIETVKVLVIGAGGIGCELLKNLAATGFKNVHVIDLDTIDISNLNRQFLFRKEHVSSSKAEIATKVVKQFNPSINLTFDHDSIFEPKFGLDFFKQFDIVMNALDNKAARNHVNRMCFAADRPLIESGSAGYFGQVLIIMRGKTECYECQEKPKQVTFPGCTIRNTPSEHIHCTVWSKHVFNQLFGEVDIDDDVSPDMKAEDTEHPNEEPSEEEKEAEVADAPKPVGTRQWAETVEYNAEKIFDKLFVQDIEYLKKMAHLWRERKQPTSLSFATALTMGDALSLHAAQQKSTDLWSMATCATVFADCMKELLVELKQSENPLSFEKDHPVIMSFVAACANIRAHIFSIQTKSLFEIKAMAGNIIPAIASTNAMVAGMIVTEAVKMISGFEGDAKCSFIRENPNVRGKMFMDDLPYPPNPNCYICSASHRVYIYVNPKEMTVLGLKEKVLIQGLQMKSPDVIDGNSFNVVISSDGDADEALPKKLVDLSINNGSILNCDDFSQDLEMKLFIRSADHLKGDQFEIARIDEEEKKKKEEARKRKVDEDEASEEPEAKKAKEDTEAPSMEVA